MLELEMTAEDITNRLDELVALAKECDRQNEHKMYYSNPYSKEIQRLVPLLEFIDLPYALDLEWYGSGMILVNKKYVVAPKSSKWRVKGKNKWYWYKNPTNFVEKYVLKETQQKRDDE